jgi:hypothetical protein
MIALIYTCKCTPLRPAPIIICITLHTLNVFADMAALPHPNPLFRPIYPILVRPMHEAVTSAGGLHPAFLPPAPPSAFSCRGFLPGGLRPLHPLHPLPSPAASKSSKGSFTIDAILGGSGPNSPGSDSEDPGPSPRGEHPHHLQHAFSRPIRFNRAQSISRGRFNFIIISSQSRC